MKTDNCSIVSSPGNYFRWYNEKASRFRLAFQNSILENVVRVTGFEPARMKTIDPKSIASANSAIPAIGPVML